MSRALVMAVSGMRTAHPGQRRFENLCGPHRKSLLRYVRWRTGDSDSAEDIVQAVLLRAWRSIKTLGDEAAVKAWLCTIARRELARAYGRRRLETEDIGALSPADALTISHEETLAVDDLQMTLATMKVRDRQVLLQALYGYSTEEIAASERCSAALARTRLFRARRRFRSLLG